MYYLGREVEKLNIHSKLISWNIYFKTDSDVN